MLDLNSKELETDPYHIAIIMDGNRRWAQKKGFSYQSAHSKGAETLSEIISSSLNFGIKVLTVYAFSTENWKRDSEEVTSLIESIKKNLIDKKPALVEKGVRLETVGDLARFPAHLQMELVKAKKDTANGNRLDLVLALNYGARDSIRRAVLSIAEDCLNNGLKPEEITENLISTRLDTAYWPYPDLLIRTGGENRLSNFLLWELSYSELYISNTLWPDFDKKEFIKIVSGYQNRERRWGC